MKHARTEQSPLTYRVKQAAALLNLPASTLYDMVRRRTIESVRVGEGRKKTVLIPAQAIADFLRRFTVPARDAKRPR